MNWINQIHVGDCRDLMRRMIADGVRVQCIVTSPPYWGLRDYGTPGQFGLERTWLRHVARARGVFRLARELLTDDGVLFLNYGDSYFSNGRGGYSNPETSTLQGSLEGQAQTPRRRSRDILKASLNHSLKPKDLVGMPWRVAFALQADGWWLRSDVIWHKPNPMPESTRDRPTKAHEYIFLLSRSQSYFYDASAIAEPSSPESHARAARGRISGYEPPGQLPHHGIAGPRPGVNRKIKMPDGWDTGPGGHGSFHRKGREKGRTREKQNASFSSAVIDTVETRNVRSVWTIPSEPFTAAHFATFPRDLVRRCILAGSRPGDIVFDPFMGSGTVAQVADELGRRFIGCELNPQYARMYGRERAAQIGAPL